MNDRNAPTATRSVTHVRCHRVELLGNARAQERAEWGTDTYIPEKLQAVLVLALLVLRSPMGVHMYKQILYC